mmetsp:Transcript_8114/g.17584  ORF Transcript_8114/g.17584 Transcript_8114/m.17584 type:complete len:407 (+) Transcript_8114:129-1349(+)|eukprot:CAMPEP_0172540708 /NCGR_PEP_ID=MMETSP1067-20121228/11656_1 /TAXON_ID=265564 ORGANISM="Thalassiosira punctigera, Strain Tpunct2005C2" /NCGR_SAMPLE_ID=MMETSP1067 /ASSEMBLY_ACC=CAM_ASM_000444 /LENGTH=406 /DNA_ID=CAMNT_0013326611 /DNA_START=128 /DNA_END=1348 /DNA_ORIENTATION=-
MMLRTASLLAALNAASASKPVKLPTADIPATSKLGSRILSASKQRNLDGDNFSWVAGYSIKFIKCATSDDYYGGYFGGEENGGNDRQNYNGMYKQRLVHYKLCPTGSCDSCSNGADYVIDMNVFVEAYIESKLDAQEYNCEQVRENCYYDDETQCYMNAGLDYCGDNDNNNNNQNGQGEQFQLEDAVECSELEVDDEALQYYYYQQQGNNQQQYYNQNGQNQNGQQQEMKLYVGPYCSANGKNIYLGTFMDETCSYPAPSGTFEKFNYGNALPYSAEKEESLIDDECVSCKEPQDQDDQNNGDQDDEDEVLEVCERLYEDAGKCESGLEDGVTYYPNTYACDFLSTLKAPGKMSGGGSSSVSASKVFAGLFAATTCVFAGVSYYLYQKARRANVNLSSQHAGGALA